MRDVQRLLLENNPHAARARFAMLVGQQPDKLAPAVQALAQMLNSAYNNFFIEPVHGFLHDAELELPGAVLDPLLRDFGPRIERTRHFQSVLRGLTRERLARETRRAIVMQDLKWAAQLAQQLLSTSDPAEQNEAVDLLGRALGDLHNDKDRVVQVLQALLKAGGPTGELAGRAIATVRTMHEAGQREMAGGDQVWSRQLTEAVLDLRPKLPGPAEVSEPSPEQVDIFFEELHAVLRAGVAGGTLSAFIDALAITFEFCPVDANEIVQVAGVEERLFTRLGPRARLVAVRALGRLGELEPMRRHVLTLAASPEGPRRLKLLCGVIGGLYHPDFFPFLKAALAKTSNDLEEVWLVDALGRLAIVPAAHELLARLAVAIKTIGGRGGDKRVRNLLVALGRATRVGRGRNTIPPEAREQIVAQIMKLVAPLERVLQFKAVEELFSHRTDELSPALRQQAVQMTVDVMWGQPLRQATRASVNGWREPMFQTLVRMGRAELPAVIEAAHRHATRYSGAMAVLANALAEIGDERAVPLLETMTRVAMLHNDDAPRGQFQQEKVIDAATEQTRELDRDEVVHSLLYALQQVGGEPGLEIILDYADQVQAGRMAPPGTNSTNLLADAKLKRGRIGEVRTHKPAAEVDEKALAKALGDAKGGLFSKKPTRIAGLAALGQMRRPDALPVLIECLGDKDAMIVGAAQTALASYLHPLPSGDDYALLLETLFAQQKQLKGGTLERVLEFLRREAPKNEPYAGIFKRQAEMLVEDPALLFQLKAAMTPADTGRVAVNPEALGRPGAGSVPGESEAAASGPGTRGALPMSELDVKREKMKAYKLAREAWMKGGRQGDPPTPPV